MNMSRSSLHRKIKALTDLSSLDFIRIIRLKHAAELLQEGELRINEICDRVGFQSPSYFAKVFQKQFGVTPTEFAQQNKQRITDS
jgi:AraC-like DNA-binding protein